MAACRKRLTGEVAVTCSQAEKKISKEIFTKILPVAIGLAAAASNFAAHDSTPGAAKTAGATATRPMDESKLLPASVKVVRLLQAGMDDKVIVAYVKSDPPPDSTSAEELVYLHELGVSTSVLDRDADACKNSSRGSDSGSRGESC